MKQFLHKKTALFKSFYEVLTLDLWRQRGDASAKKKELNSWNQ